ncbi:hypothetical protein H0J01_001023 [Listeria monocytogenes]|uniref:hypothetical protein n=1 Tax=Listeria monocytogenes TaxID=1639 RepID=UPI000E71216A|nr:hypothetical protein [Listeria monocytogenes]EAE0271720.1 hypothetical protein [Listeria monocytogenes]EAE0420473.1 hypothetical protein [Listeria monocytogenes]EAF2384294.1 hypothetical protein [Listeria monocytogenes]EAL8030653.1 hypothetical protein [Listeria monocytogenes]EFQ9581186.1 hypothetical protein [Listeria monocytogenes]
MFKKNNELNEELSTTEILTYFEGKYQTPHIVTTRTIKRWIDELQIEHITSPPPKRNADIKYKKEDVLKLEHAKRKKLLQHRDKYLSKEWKEKKAEEQFGIFVEYQNELLENGYEEASHTDSIYYIYKQQAKEIIFKEKVEMCFEHLFPNIEFDVKELENKLFIRDENPYHPDGIEADEYIKKKFYKK